MSHATYFPSMAPATQRREKIRRRTRQSSIQQYAVARETLVAKREAEALRRIAAHWNRYQESPTIGELAYWLLQDQQITADADSWQFMGARLWLARGVSGLQKRGLVEAVPEGERKCGLTDITVETWRVVTAGRTP